MANQSRRKQFKAPVSVDHTIVDGKGNIYGHLRIKPSSILWKPRRERQYFNVKIKDFDSWIKSTSKARKTKV